MSTKRNTVVVGTRLSPEERHALALLLDAQRKLASEAGVMAEITEGGFLRGVIRRELQAAGLFVAPVPSHIAGEVPADDEPPERQRGPKGARRGGR